MTETGIQIDRRLQQAVGTAIAASPPLRNEYRRARRARRPSLWKIFYCALLFVTSGPMVFVVLPLIMLAGVHDQWAADEVLAIVAVLSTFASLVGAQFFVLRLRKAKAISVLSHFPARDAEIARQVWREPAAWSLALLYVSVLAFGYLAWKNAFGFGGWSLAAALATLQWLTCLATGTILAVFLPRFPFQAAYFLVLLAAFIYGQLGAPHAADVTIAIYVVLPAGWVNAVLGLAFLQQIAPAWWAAVAAMTWIACLVLALRRLARVYVIRELAFPPDSEACATLAPPFALRESLFARLYDLLFPWFAKIREGEDPQLSDAEAERRIRGGSFLRPTVRPRSKWIERIVDYWLTDRERGILELLTANRARWSTWWWSLAFGGMTAGFLFGAGALPVAGNAGAAAIMVGCLSLFGVWTGPWPGFRTKECAGAFLPYFAVLPIGFDEITRVMLKAGLVRCLTLFVLVVLLAAAGIGALNLNLRTAILGLTVYASLLAVLQGWAICFYLSLGMRFPDLRLKTLGWHVAPILLILGSLFVGVPLVIVGLTQRVPGADYFFASGILILASSSWANWRLLRTMYHRGMVDLVRNSRSNEEEMLHVYDAAENRRLRSEELHRRYGWFWWLRRRDEMTHG